MIRQGLPITIEWLGTLQLTYELGAINTSSPITILPTTVALIPIHTSSPIIGAPLPFPSILLTDDYASVQINVAANFCIWINCDAKGVPYI